MDTPVVSDTGPLISLEKITDGYAFIRKLCKSIIVPQAVLREVSAGNHDAYLSRFKTTDLIEVHETIPVPFIEGRTSNIERPNDRGTAFKIRSCRFRVRGS